MNVIVSACLLGEPCRFDAQSKDCPAVHVWLAERGATAVPVCPEQLGGLPTPREPSERQADGTVRMRTGADVTAEFELGAQRTLEAAEAAGATVAILKAKSPSCGVGHVYDGSFSDVLTEGDGCTAELLRAQGIELHTELSLPALQ